jgi:prostaglandin-E synthase
VELADYSIQKKIMAAFNSNTVNTAPVKWAQRVDSVYVTISLPDVQDAKLDVKDKTLEFTGTSGGKAYQLSLEFVRKS